MKTEGQASRAGADGAQGVPVPLEPVSETASLQRQIAQLRAQLNERTQAASETVAELRARAEQAEARAEQAVEELRGLRGQLQARARAEAAASQTMECLGGCGIPLLAEYVRRTGEQWHGPCEKSLPAALRALQGVAS